MIDWVENNKNYLAYRNGKYMGLVSQNPDSPEVENPGKWTAVVHTKDGGLWSLGWFDRDSDALAKVEDAILRDWTYDQWKNS